MRFLRENSLSVFFLGIFFASDALFTTFFQRNFWEFSDLVNKGDDRPGPGQPDGVVQVRQRPGEQVLERGEDAGEDHAKSTPPWLHGLQRRIRHAAFAEPFTSPCAFSASRAYLEQVGCYLHVFGGVSRPKVYRQA